MRVVRAVSDLDVYIEQPCLTYEECLAVRRNTNHPFVLDENIDGLDMLLRAKADLAMDGCESENQQAGWSHKDQTDSGSCVSMGIAMTLEDSWEVMSQPPPSRTWRTALLKSIALRAPT